MDAELEVELNDMIALAAQLEDQLQKVQHAEAKGDGENES
jgi:hypothetical protein